MEFPGSADGPWARYIDPASLCEPPRPPRLDSSDTDGSPQRTRRDAEEDNVVIGTVRYPRIVPLDDECAKKLKKRTLTNLYNERPAWLDLAHKKLDEAVAAAYGWPANLDDEAILEKLLDLTLQRASEQALH